MWRELVSGSFNSKDSINFNLQRGVMKKGICLMNLNHLNTCYPKFIGINFKKIMVLYKNELKNNINFS